jgi:hypothetical protein
MKKYMQELAAPKEKMDDVELDFMDDPDDPEAAGGDPDMTPEEQELAGYLDVSDGHKQMARVMLMGIDKFLAFVAGMITGMDMDRYKRSKNPDNYEVEVTVTAAMMKKYEVQMSLEWMFAVMIIGAYSPTFQKAYADYKAMKAKREKQRREDELRILAQNIHRN